jgi:peptide chain release factor
MTFIQLSAGQGPDECCLAVAKTLHALQQEALKNHCELLIVESEEAARPATFKSVLLKLQPNQSQNNTTDWIMAWQGSLLWICESPYRPRHPRKNWFIGIRLFQLEEQTQDAQIHYEACRASGPGGQHVNKTDSAVRATHLATGISVKVQTERSQFANKKLASLLIAKKLLDRDEQKQQQHRRSLRASHHDLSRGDARLIFKGTMFKRIK